MLASGTTVELREIVLRDKPQSMLDASPKGTVPVLVLADGTVIDESRDIAEWALGRNDPLGWLLADPGAVDALIRINDGPFKAALDRYKYPDRYPGEGERADHRAAAAEILADLEMRLATTGCLLGDRAGWADHALLPFVRQFAHVDRAWFWAQPWPNLIAWLDRFLASSIFTVAMERHPVWQPGKPSVHFGAAPPLTFNDYGTIC